MMMRFGVKKPNDSVCLTVESSAVQILKVSAVSTSAAVVSWNSVTGATGYRLAWGPTPGDFTL